MHIGTGHGVDAVDEVDEHLLGGEGRGVLLEIRKAVLHHRGHLGVAEGKTFSDVHLSNVFREGVEERLQQIFVAKHHSGALGVGGEVGLEPRSHALCLRHFGRSRHHLDVLNVA